jgi:ABC-type multidrug transport system ATPase subunit
MTITLTNAGKRFNREWIFRGMNYDFTAPKKYAITGSNGSGKSTLLQVIAGSLTFNEGAITLKSGKQETNDGKQEPVNNDHHFQYISIAAPYLELVEEMTANEMLDFHTQFKPLTIAKADALEVINLTKAADRQQRHETTA